MNPRKFIKNMNNVLIQQEFNNLNRNKEFINKSTDDELSLKILKEKYRKKGLFISKFRTFKDHELKAFAVKKIMNELLTLENLKIRRPDLYKENLNCVRCNEQKEDLDHLWNCRTVTNDILFIGLKSNRFLNKILAGEKKKDDIIDALFKYTKLERELKIFNTRENTEFYHKNKDIRIARTYIWNGNNSLDTLLRDWIPKESFLIMKKFIRSKKKIEDILIRWIIKINKWFFDRIWKPRNEILIEWEKNKNISQKDKKSKSLKINREIRFEKRKKVKEKLDITLIDTYQEIRRLYLWSKNSIKGQSYHVLIIYRLK